MAAPWLGSQDDDVAVRRPYSSVSALEVVWELGVFVSVSRFPLETLYLH
jgi:hypothetical protein